MRRLRRTARAATASAWRVTSHLVRWATSPRDRRGRVLRLTLATWVAGYLAMSIVDFLRVGAPTWWVVVLPTTAAAIVAGVAVMFAWHPSSGGLVDVVRARQVRSHFATGSAPTIAGLPDAVARHRVASSCAPRRLRRAQRAEVAQLVGEVNHFVVAAHTVDLVRVDLSDGTVRSVPGAESSYDDLLAVAAHRVRRIDELTDQAVASSLDARLAVAGHLDQVAVAARLAAQRQVDGDQLTVDQAGRSDVR